MSYNTINIFDRFCIVNYHYLDVHLSRYYMCNTYNLTSGLVNMLVTHHLLPIQSRMEVIPIYIYSYYTYFLVTMEILSFPHTLRVG